MNHDFARYMKVISISIISVGLIISLWLAIAIDSWVAESLNMKFEIVFITVGIAAGILSFQLKKHWTVLVLPFSVVLFMIILPFLNLTAVKPAIRALHRVSPGMTEARVRALFKEEFSSHGHFKTPEIRPLQAGVLSFVVDPTDGCCDSPIIRIQFSDGKSVSTQFDPD